MNNYDWIVVGAAITGAAMDYELGKAGFSVLLVEQHQTPANATGYNYGGLACWWRTTPLTRQFSCGPYVGMGGYNEGDS
jgi:glycine/D-amino acid oxidase-like deaminating enzyme